MKKIIFATFIALLAGNSSCKDEVDPCGMTADNPSAYTPKFCPPLRLDNTYFEIRDKTGKILRYLPQEIKVYDAQQKLVPVQISDEAYFQRTKISFSIKGADIFTNPAFGANVPTSHTLYLQLKDEKHTLVIDTHIKSFCNVDSIGYLKTTQDNLKTIVFFINNRLINITDVGGIPIFIQK